MSPNEKDKQRVEQESAVAEIREQIENNWIEGLEEQLIFDWFRKFVNEGT